MKKMYQLALFAICCGLAFSSNVGENPNHGLMADLQQEGSPITKAMVDAYWGKKVTELTINQITTEQCPEIEVVVSLLDDQGNPISGLTSRDFQLREDGVILPVNVRPSDSGIGSEIALAICIDVSGSLSFSDFQNEKDAAIQLVNLLGNSDQVAIYAFGSGVRLFQDFTSDKQAAITAINNIPRGGSTSLFDGVYEAALNTSQQNGRKAVVVMTDGADNSSQRNSQEVINLARSANIPLFSIGFGNANAVVLESVSNQTGGLFFPSASSAGLLQILDQIGTILGQQYILSYRTNAPDGGNHELDVAVTVAGQTLSSTRTYSSCLFQAVPDAPIFINNDNFYYDADGNFICIFPDPNSDGSNIDELDGFGYQVFIQVNCTTVMGPIAVNLENPDDSWPRVLTLSSQNLPTEPFSVSVGRTYSGNQASEIPQVEVQIPLRSETAVPTNVRNYQRWLLHAPKQTGGYQTTLRLDNETPVDTKVALAGFDELGNLLKVVEVSVTGLSQVYRDLYDSELFAEFPDQVSHVGIFEQAKLATVWVQYRNLSSSFVSWSREISLPKGEATGSVLNMETRQSLAYIDGAVVLNLSNLQTIQTWVVQRKQSTGEVLREVALNPIPPGGKQTLLLSQVFPFESDVVYQFETRDANKKIQALGLSFFGNEFFAPVPVIRP